MACVSIKTGWLFIQVKFTTRKQQFELLSKHGDLLDESGSNPENAH
jgi:hypothetical protein